jgi:EAL domain-containing protein (putative c-di-GMP-specific phosphodiesterase class I)/CheY-like chemotaxis protein
MPQDSHPPDATVFFFGCDAPLRATLQACAAAHALALMSVQTVAGLMYAAAIRTPRVLILQTDALPPGRSLAAILERLEEAAGTCPRLIHLAAQPQSPGISAASGRATSPAAFATFQAPFDAARIWARVSDALAQRSARVRRVLVVDAAPAEGDEIVAALSAAGLLVERVADPQRAMAALEQTPADLIVLDLNLPQDATRALTAAIRRDESLGDVPIIFLAAPIGANQQGEVLRLGGDEYLARPVVGERLVTAVVERLAQCAAAPGPAPDTAGEGAPVLSRTQLIKRLDGAILDRATPAEAQAVLFIRVDDTPARGRLDAAGFDAVCPLIIELVRRCAGAAQRGVCRHDDGVCAWVHCPSEPQIMDLAAAIRAGAAALALPPGLTRVTLSIGIGSFEPPADNALSLISRAWAAAEEACRAGGDRVLRRRDLEPPAPPGDDTADERSLRLVRDALDGSGFHLVYQPILSLRKSHRERYEVLLRLRTPQGEILPPAAFLPVAARHGLLPAVDRWVLRRALETLRRERDAGRPTLLVIFQSGASLAEPDWIDWVRAEVLRLDLIRQRPVLEFNAQDVLAAEDQARVLFPELGRLGIEVCLAGVTDREDLLGLIARRPIGTAKLARDLIGRARGAAFKSLVEALHRRHARVIAAGIEDPETIGRLWSSGVDYLQGNFIQFPEETLNFQFHAGVVE